MSTSPFVTHPGVICTAEGIAALAARLKGESVIAFDTEFIRENTFFPIVEIIQIATDRESWLVDAKAFKTWRAQSPNPKGLELEALRPLLDIFADPQILKIVHAAQGDQECLYTSFGVVATPSLDTAVAASLCGMGDGIGLGNLLKVMLGVNLKKGHARTDWSIRPLPEQLEEYAHADVVHLVELGQTLLEKLDELGRREWAMEQTARFEDKTAYEPNIDDLALRLARGGRFDKKGMGVLRELVRWREERVRVLNLPRRWVADDNVLTDLAQVRPKDVQHLSAFRGLNKGELKNGGEAILSAIQRGLDAPDMAAPKYQRSDVPSTEESQVLDLLKCYVGILADRHRIATRHLVISAQLLPLLRSEAKTAADLVTDGLLSEGSGHLVGEEILAFLRGKRALSVEGSQIRIVSLKD